VAVNEERGLNARLSRAEKAKLAILAAQAHAVMARHGATDEHVDEFRQRIAIQACGLRVSEARRRHFNDIKAAFLVILGNTAGALNAAERSGTEEVRIAMHKLRAELHRHGLHEGYAEHICAAKFKRSLADATPKQVWSVFYDVKKNRGRGTKATGTKAQSANPF
jgi:hypothetical protein